MAEMLEAIRGMTRDEILDMLEASVHAEAIRDPEALADFLIDQSALS